MADLKQWPYALNQPGYEYPAELFRAEHHDATSGGNGVGAPTALKVTAQAAPDGTVSIPPGGATAKSTYAGADGQSYHARNFQPVTLPVPPTGSGGGRTDLLVLRVCDPQYDVHPDHAGEMTDEAAAGLDFWWFELLQGQNRNAQLPYPHVKLAEIVRPANTTIVTDAHIRDLRVMASSKAHRAKYDQMVGERTEVIRNGTWRTLAEVPVEVPDWATHAAIDVSLGGAYMKGVAGRGDFGMTGLGNTSSIGHTPWWEARGDATGFRRIPYIQAGRKLNVMENFRGKTAIIYIIARVSTQSDSGFIFGADYGARAFVDIDWLQDVE